MHERHWSSERVLCYLRVQGSLFYKGGFFTRYNEIFFLWKLWYKVTNAWNFSPKKIQLEFCVKGEIPKTSSYQATAVHQSVHEKVKSLAKVPFISSQIFWGCWVISISPLLSCLKSHLFRATILFYLNIIKGNIVNKLATRIRQVNSNNRKVHVIQSSLIFPIIDASSWQHVNIVFCE